MLGYDRDDKYMYYMSHNHCTCKNPLQCNNNHDPQPVYESTNNKLLWDFKIQTDNKIEHNKPVLNEMEQKCLIIDVACPFDT